MIKKILAVFILIAIISVSAVVYADTPEINALYNSENRVLTVYGIGYGDFMITVTEKVINVDGEDITLQEMSSDKLPLIFKQIQIAGEFSKSFTIPKTAKVGKYNVYLSGSEGNASVSFILIDLTETEELIKKLNSEKKSNNKKGFVKILSESAQELGIDTEDGCYIENAEKISDFLYKVEFGIASEFTAQYNKAHTLLSLLNKDEDSILSAIDKNSNKIDGVISDDIINDARLDENAKNFLIKKLSEGDFIDYVDENGEFLFDKVLEKMKALSALQASEYWVQLKKIVTTDFEDTFKELLSNKKYEDIKDKDMVFEKMLGKTFDDFDGVEEAFNKAVKTVYDKENPQKETSSSKPSGSGGGGGIGTAVTTPHFETADTNDLPAEEKKEGEKGVFSDFDEKHWAYKAVMELCANGVISGFPDGTFLPSKPVTRAELTKMITAFTEDITVGDYMEFSDVKAEDWYYKYVSESAAKGIVVGNNGSFLPNNKVKREDAAVIIYRVLSLRGEAPIAQRYFPDRNNISTYAKEAVEALGSIDIIKGNEEGLFMPQSSLSRAEAAQLIYNAFMTGR